MTPAPDGRGTPPSTKPPAHRTRGFIWFVVGLLALNWLSVLLFEPSTQTRVTVPFSPYFIKQVTDNKVESITTKAGAVQGTFRVARYLFREHVVHAQRLGQQVGLGDGEVGERAPDRDLG